VPWLAAVVADDTTRLWWPTAHTGGSRRLLVMTVDRPVAELPTEVASVEG
jgi:hypothetical protein